MAEARPGAGGAGGDGFSGDRAPVRARAGSGGGAAPSVAVPADRVDAEEQPRLSERERRWADRMEEDDEEAECGEGPSAPALLQGDDLAGAEGYDVTEEPASTDNHISCILDGGDDDYV